MPTKKLLLLSEGFGLGHTQAALALSTNINLMNNEIETQVLELGAVLHPTLAPLIFTMFRKTITTSPKLYNIVYRQYNKAFGPVTRLALHRLFYAQAAELIEKSSPDAIVCTHPFPNAVITRLKAMGLSIPLYTVITDYELHGAWISDQCDAYFVSTSDMNQKLIRQGINPQNIKVTGIPVHPNFKIRHNKERIRLQYQLNSLPTVLIMGGGWGLIEKNELMRHMMNWRDRIQFIFCFGHNDKTLHKFAEDPLYQHPHIKLIGFTPEIHKLMDVSDLLITKPGGLTCTEAALKGIPTLFYKPLPGQEEGNCQFFTGQGFGEEIKSPATIDAWFNLLLKERRPIGLTARNRFNPFLPSNETCAATLLQLLNEIPNQVSGEVEQSL